MNYGQNHGRRRRSHPIRCLHQMIHGRETEYNRLTIKREAMIWHKSWNNSLGRNVFKFVLPRGTYLFLSATS